jgi:hypothetical protein
MLPVALTLGAVLLAAVSAAAPPGSASAASAASVAPVAPVAFLQRDPGCGTLVVVQRADALLYRLPRTFLQTGSDSAWSRTGPWRRGADYVIEPLRGELRLLRPPLPGDTLWVAACWLLAPPALEWEAQRYRPARPPGASDSATAAPRASPAPGAHPATARSPLVAPEGASLAVNGNKTIAVDFGSSQDAFLRQSLDLAVSGTLSPGVQLTGVLSDRNLPLTSAGSTQDLQALDRVMIELTAPRGSAALGDVSLNLQQGEFGRLDRRVQGVRGEWAAGGFRGLVAAASSQGEYLRVQFYGAEGQQGPYQLRDRSGNAGISVVAGSEVVTVDGARMARGEGADYAIDYERARLTFTNRRPITATSRITVDYQYTLNRYRRNLVSGAGRWESGGFRLYTQAISESDDQGRPLDLTLSVEDLAVLAAAGDSAALALGPGVVAGGGDYDLIVRVATDTLVYYAYAGPALGDFSVQFARVGPGLGEYADSLLSSGRTAYRWMGAGGGAFRIGRALPLAESHQLWSLGTGVRAGALQFDLEGAVSKFDPNTFSTRDDAGHTGGAGRVSAGLEGRLPGVLGAGGLLLAARAVNERFAPFARYERPFEQEDWGLPVSGDLQHARRVELTGFVRPRVGGELRALGGRLTLPGGFSSWRRGLEWQREGRIGTRARWERADATQPGQRFADGGRERWSGELRLRLPWLEPALRAETDERRFAGDTALTGDRYRETGAELRSPARLAWRALAGWSLRRDGRLVTGDFVDQSQARTLRFTLETPASAAFSAVLNLQRRQIEPLADPRRSRSDLASVRLKGEQPRQGLRGHLDLEITSEGENQRVRRAVYVGAGKGGYDVLGNFVGTGDYDLVVVVSEAFTPVARAATSARAEWQLAGQGAWRGTRAGFDFETESRRRGELRVLDPFLAPGAALGDPTLSRASVLQRLEAEVAPESRSAALRLRAERRVTGDRAYENFAQTLDDRTLSARWRTRPSTVLGTELEARARRRVAVQALVGSAGYARTLVEQTGTGQLVYTPGTKLRVVGTLEFTRSRPEGGTEYTRTLRSGPDLGYAFGKRGRAELRFRRAFVTGPPAVNLLPTADPAGVPRWEAAARADYRVQENTTASLSVDVRERPGRAALTTGRAELRAFF